MPVILGAVANYSLGDAARILKVTPSRLRYWDQTKLVQSRLAPERPCNDGFDFRDLVCIRGILSLLDQGVSLQRIRRSVDALRQRVPDLDDPIATMHLWVEGSRRVVVDHDGVLLEPSGQMCLDFRSTEAQAQAIGKRDTEEQGEAIDAMALFEEGCRLDGEPATYDKAIDLYRRGIAIDPDFADLHCNLGAVYYNRGERREARRCFERCLELCPGHVEAHFNLGNVLEEVGCDDMALRHYRVAVEADPFCLDLHINLALLYEKLGQRAKGRAHWRRYLKLDSEGAWADVARMRLEEE